MADYFPPASFYFNVSIDGMESEDKFQEVSGLSVEQDVLDIVEGGENDFVWRVPGRTKYTNLTLKRGMLTKDSDLVKWIHEHMENPAHLSKSMKTNDLRVELMDETGEPLTTWTFTKAYPVKWSVSNLNSQDNSVVIETIEFAYLFFSFE